MAGIAFYITPLSELEVKLPFQKDLINQFKKKMEIFNIVDSLDELRQFKSLNFEQLQGNRSHEYSIRLNLQYGLIFSVLLEKIGTEVEWPFIFLRGASEQCDRNR